MAKEEKKSNEAVPLGQRLLDSPFLLLAAGLVVMLAFYTLWGLAELMTMPPATLP
ncbi:MAG: hypothetical protein OEW12_04855 [Deltaproteobacteria bacterium]|nr:hypothetical protein [Deltaproteobacteria bacterium]